MSQAADTFEMTAKTFEGLEAVLAEELKTLGASAIEPGKRAVTFEGDQAMLYRANLHLRTALSILVPVHSFIADDEEELYRKALQVEWDGFFDATQTFAISFAVNSTLFRHSQFAALRVKDAIVDYFRKKKGKRPSVDKDNPDIRINLHISGNRVVLSFDSSGTPLFKRGYRIWQSEAGLNEVLAAGMIKLAGWNDDRDMIDPMCGSGTLALEAAMMALNIPAGYYRNDFSFFRWPDFDRGLWEKIRREAGTQIRQKMNARLFASDVSARNIERAKHNARLFPDDAVTFDIRDFFDSPAATLPALVIMNPPYGERLATDEDVPAFYHQIGDTLKQRYSGCQAWIISSNLEAIKSVGLKPSRKIPLYNGPLECRFMRFDLYTGSLKTK